MRKKTKRWLAFLALSLLGIFLLWFFWKDLERTATPAKKKVSAQKPSRSPQERISEEDQEKLEQILKRR